MQQYGAVDCGLIALANATALHLGDDTTAFLQPQRNLGSFWLML